MQTISEDIFEQIVAEFNVSELYEVVFKSIQIVFN